MATAEELQAVFAEELRDVAVRLGPGEYRLDPRPLTDPTCGNCPDPRQEARTTVGLHVRGRGITLQGPTSREEGEAVLHTGAGYGVYVEGARDVVIERLTITGGERSEDRNATDGAIVARGAG